jgi:O-antigen ligase
LLRGGYTPAATMLLQWVGLGLVVLVVWQSRPMHLRVVELTFLGLLFGLPALYLVPLPAALVEWLPARDLYMNARALVSDEVSGAHHLSIYPLATELSWMILIVPIGVYLATRALPESMQIRLVYLFLAVALVQVLIALFQFATAGGVSYSLVELLGRSGSSGTYVNRNHLAGMIEMALPLALAMFLYDFGGKFTSNRRRTGLRDRIVAVLKSSNRPSWIFVLLALFFTIGVIVTRSRTGIAMGMLGILLTMILFSRRVGGRGTFGLMGQLVTISIGVAIFLGLAPVLDRFSVAELDADARWPIAVASFDAAGRLLPFGSGPGTYPDVFALYQPLELGRWFINYAHNDYIQALFEVGLPGLVLIAMFWILYVAQWPRLVTPEEWSRFRSLQIGSGIAMLLLLLHSMTDNNLQNPANLAYFALLAGLFFSPPGVAKLSDRPRRRRRRTVSLTDVPPSAASGDVVSADDADDADVAPTRRRSPNPFDDPGSGS